MLNEATKANLRRKSAYVDAVQMAGGVPLPSWIDLSLTELCNRSAGSKKACVFCPRIDPTFYPNQKLHMGLDLIRKIAGELLELNYEGVVVLCGYGEPMLHPQIMEIISTLSAVCRVELVTNGDRLTERTIAQLYENGLTYCVVSLYDGPEQVEPMHAKFAAAGITEYLIRDRWHTEADDFGLKLTNRGGTVSVGNQDEVQSDRPCLYSSYQLQVDWNGDVLLCPQDWHKKVRFGNLANTNLIDIWTSAALHKKRMQLARGDRSSHPCGGCNTDGCLHGFNHVKAWADAAGGSKGHAVLLPDSDRAIGAL
jgi:radical SAM protein with 4Fe4S-binding SPASM domain